MAVDLDRVTDYIAGRLSPIENHAFELQLMEDSELQDALEELLLLRDHAIRRQPESAHRPPWSPPVGKPVFLGVVRGSHTVARDVEPGDLLTMDAPPDAAEQRIVVRQGQEIVFDEFVAADDEQILIVPAPLESGEYQVEQGDDTVFLINVNVG